MSSHPLLCAQLTIADYRQQYVEMKTKEKGIKTWEKTLLNPRKGGFNAFKLMTDGKKGQSQVRAAADDVKEEAEDETLKPPVIVMMEDKEYILREDGTADESELEFHPGKVLKYTGAGEGKVEYREIKVSRAD